MTKPDRTALITGASEGIGRELVKLMAAEGWKLVLTARREKLMQELASTLKTDVHVIPADLSDPAEPQRLYDEVQSGGIQLDALVNNAGFGMVGAFKDADPDRVMQLIQVNITSLVKLTRLFLPAMIERGSGRIMNVASVAGFLPMPYFAVYAASKAFVLDFSVALDSETRGSGVTVTCLCPGPTPTGFGKVAGYPSGGHPQPGTLSAEMVAMLGYRGMMKGKRIIVTGGLNRFLVLGSRKLPMSLIVRIAKRIMRKRI